MLFDSFMFCYSGRTNCALDPFLQGKQNESRHAIELTFFLVSKWKSFQSTLFLPWMHFTSLSNEWQNCGFIFQATFNESMKCVCGKCQSICFKDHIKKFCRMYEKISGKMQIEAMHNHDLFMLIWVWAWIVRGRTLAQQFVFQRIRTELRTIGEQKKMEIFRTWIARVLFMYSLVACHKATSVEEKEKTYSK